MYLLRSVLSCVQQFYRENDAWSICEVLSIFMLTPLIFALTALWGTCMHAKWTDTDSFWCTMPLFCAKICHNRLGSSCLIWVQFINIQYYQKLINNRGGSWISVKRVHMYKGAGVRFAYGISFFLNISWKLNNWTSLRSNSIHRIFKNGVQVGDDSSEPPEPPLNPQMHWRNQRGFRGFARTPMRQKIHFHA